MFKFHVGGQFTSSKDDRELCEPNLFVFVHGKNETGMLLMLLRTDIDGSLTCSSLSLSLAFVTAHLT